MPALRHRRRPLRRRARISTVQNLRPAREARACSPFDSEAGVNLAVIEKRRLQHERGVCSVIAHARGERIFHIKWVKSSKYGLTYYRELFEFFGIELVELNKPKPLQCTAPCTFPVNTEQLRYKVRLILRNSHAADVNCIIDAYFPAFLEINIHEV